jgi:hypothetical protein
MEVSTDRDVIAYPNREGLEPPGTARLAAHVYRGGRAVHHLGASLNSLYRSMMYMHLLHCISRAVICSELWKLSIERCPAAYRPRPLVAKVLPLFNHISSSAHSLFNKSISSSLASSEREVPRVPVPWQ